MKTRPLVASDGIAQADKLSPGGPFTAAQSVPVQSTDQYEAYPYGFSHSSNSQTAYSITPVIATIPFRVAVDATSALSDSDTGNYQEPELNVTNQLVGNDDSQTAQFASYISGRITDGATSWLPIAKSDGLLAQLNNYGDSTLIPTIPEGPVDITWENDTAFTDTVNADVIDGNIRLKLNDINDLTDLAIGTQIVQGLSIDNQANLGRVLQESGSTNEALTQLVQIAQSGDSYAAVQLLDNVRAQAMDESLIEGAAQYQQAAQVAQQEAAYYRLSSAQDEHSIYRYW
jgi:hypothetical protein